jgi:DNA-directed RNA polymerase subunit beta'
MKLKSWFKIIQTTARVLFNEVVPEAAGYINDVLTKKNLRDIIGHVLNSTSVPKRRLSWIT